MLSRKRYGNMGQFWKRTRTTLGTPPVRYDKADNVHEATMLSMYLLLVQFLFSLVMYSLPLSGTMANKIKS